VMIQASLRKENRAKNWRGKEEQNRVARSGMDTSKGAETNHRKL